MEENLVCTQTEGENGVSSENEGETNTPKIKEGVVIPVKFNKQIKNLSADEAAVLAQKGMKFEIIQNDFSKLRAIAAKENLSVPDYIDALQNRQRQERKEDILKECGGNEDFAEHILNLEESQIKDDGLDELKEYFPSIKTLEDLPESVVESARLKGENLLNEYLRYRFLKQRQSNLEKQSEILAETSSVGSLKNPVKKDAGNDFIKALWGR